jgi:molybdopterin synthase catalytic subunit
LPNASLPTIVMSQSITVTLECFGELQARMGAAQVSLTLEAPYTPAALIETAARRYPEAADLLARTACARGDSLLATDARLSEGDTIALIPPVSGGQAESSDSHLTAEPLDLADLMAETEDDECGALVVFGGTVRLDNNNREVESIDYSAYGPLAAKTLAEIEAETVARFAARACRIQHRSGRLSLGETSVYVVVRAKHRGQAFDAARHAIETLKQRAAIWKNEHYADGTSEYMQGCAVPTPDAKGGAS